MQPYINELINIAKSYLSMSVNKTHEHEIFERTLTTIIDYSITNDIPIEQLEQLLQIEEVISQHWRNYCETFTRHLGNTAINSLIKSVNQQEYIHSNYLINQIERMDLKFNVKGNLILAEIMSRSGHIGATYKYCWNALTNNKHSKVLITGSIYNLFLYMLLFNDWRDTCFIIGKDISYKIIDKLLANNVAALYSESLLPIIDPYTDTLRKFALHVKEENMPIYGHDHIYPARYFIGENFNVIEDGFSSYSKPNCVIPMENGEEYIPFGYDNKIKRLYLTGRIKVPDIIKSKVILFDIIELWKQKSPQEQEVLLDIFSVPITKLIKLLDSGKNQIFITEGPTYKAGKISKEQMINFYHKILSNYDASKIIIKVHPRDDEIDYEKYFPQYYILRDQFPFEFIKLLELDTKIEKLIALNSTVIYGIFDNKIIETYKSDWN